MIKNGLGILGEMKKIT